ncbi:MAG: hypothetical protein R3Y18_05860 [Bacillota bacterium]
MIIKNKFFVGLTIALAIFATAVFGIVALNNVETASDISYNGSEVVFSGVYDTEVSLEGAEIEMVSTPVVMKMRFSGDVSETSMQGNFKIEDEEEVCFAAIMARDTDYIKITNGEEVFIFNFESAEETSAFYASITK